MQNDDAYANAAYIPDGAEYPQRWAAAAAAFRDGARARLGEAYGEDERERFDLFLPEGRPEGLVVFVHGGYWRAFGRELWSHLARGPVERGWAVAIPSYKLAPHARIAAITRQVGQAIVAAGGLIDGPVRLTGHSAGGQLVARMLMADGPLPDSVKARIAGVVPISPVADLRPLLLTSMNVDLRLDAAEALAESPALRPRALFVPVTVWVGAEERPVFLDQARWLSDAWGVPCHVAPGRHHFDVIAPLEDGGSDLVAALLGWGCPAAPGSPAGLPGQGCARLHKRASP